MTKILHTFTNQEAGMSAFVFKSAHKVGGFGVSVRDDESGLYLDVSFHGFKTLELAIAKAQEVLIN